MLPMFFVALCAFNSKVTPVRRSKVHCLCEVELLFIRENIQEARGISYATCSRNKFDHLSQDIDNNNLSLKKSKVLTP